jgi:hypothetical protein
MEKKIAKYVEKRPFPSFEKCKVMIDKYESNVDYTRYEYIMQKKIYENLGNDRKVITYGQLLHEMKGCQGLSRCCLMMNILFENCSWRVMQCYGRKLEFIFQAVTPDWDA